MTADADADALRGLTDAEVAERTARGQTNRFVPDTSRSAWNIIRANVLTLFNAIVLSCFLALFLVGRWQDALFGFSALANAVIGSVQEFRAKTVLDRLALLNAPTARVRRAGGIRELEAADVVLGDLLVLRAGDQIPADAEVVAARGLQLDESMLTGESEAVDKASGDELLSGSIIVAGEGEARVTHVGADAFANRFAGEARRFSLVSSELRTSINRVLAWVAWAIGPIGLLVFNAQVLAAGGYRRAFTTDAWVQAVVNTIAALIAMIPLGLVLMTSIAFAVGAAKLARRGVLVNELPAVEVLARVDVICLDKTGTLTLDEIVFDRAVPVAEMSGWDVALARFAHAPDANTTARALAEAFPVGGAAPPSTTIPFSSVRKWSALTDAAGTWVMGAPELIVANDTVPAEVAEQIAESARSGRRTLLLAHAAAPLSEADVEAERLPEGLRPAAVLTLRERVRADAADTLAYFADQGVGIRVISGDTPATVAAILRDLGVDAGEGVDARFLPEDDAELAELLDTQTVFGRVTPDQKKRMVLALQARGHTVAMTGDGVNDALAIKAADIGIAMGAGSPATKAVARLVLLDGRFAHLPDVVAEGRRVIANIERVSMLFLTKTVYATALAVLFGLLALQFPLLPRQLSVTDGLTIGIPAFFLALLPNARRYVPGFLRRSLGFAIPVGALIAVTITWFALFSDAQPVSQEQVRTGATVIILVLGIWVLSVLARPLTPITALIVVMMIAGGVAVFLIPLVARFLELTELSRPVTLAATVACVAGVVAIELALRLRAPGDATRRPWARLLAGAAVLTGVQGALALAAAAAVVSGARIARVVGGTEGWGGPLLAIGLLLAVLAVALRLAPAVGRIGLTAYLAVTAIVRLTGILHPTAELLAAASVVFTAPLVLAAWVPWAHSRVGSQGPAGLEGAVGAQAPGIVGTVTPRRRSPRRRV